jgi:hypothetical protein
VGDARGRGDRATGRRSRFRGDRVLTLCGPNAFPARVQQRQQLAMRARCVCVCVCVYVCVCARFCAAGMGSAATQRNMH